MASMWIYKNLFGDTVGPISNEEMSMLYSQGRLPANLSLRRENESSFRSLLEICITENRIPFSLTTGSETEEDNSKALDTVKTVFITIGKICDRALQREEGNNLDEDDVSMTPDHSSEPKKMSAFSDDDDDDDSNNVSQHLHQEKVGVFGATCETCGKKFVHKGSLTKHVNTIHKGIRIPCTRCKKTFANSSALRRHFLAVHKNKRYKCKSCGNLYTTKMNLAEHINIVHRNISTRRCKKCKKVFRHRSALSRHVHHRCKARDNVQPSSDSSIT